MTGNCKKALICVDGSEHSTRAFDWYVDNVYRFGETVGLVHVQTLPDVPVSIGMHSADVNFNDLYEEALHKSIAKSKAVVLKFKEKCTDKGLPFEIYAEPGNETVGHTICEIAKANHASIIVIGQRGLGAIRRTLFGSVSDYVLHHSHLPVIVVPPA